jgi:DNA-binding transcriptional regulator YiaG
MTSKTNYRYKGECDKEPYHYTECGLDDVYLLSGYEIEDTEYGQTVSVKDADALHVAIGVYLATQTKVLSGKELRFLRKQMDLTQAELGQSIGVSDQSVARWEKEQCEIGPADALIRLLYLDRVGKLPPKIKEMLDSLKAKDSDPQDGKHVFAKKKNGEWIPRLAA